MERQLHVDTAGVHAMATRWGAAVGDLHAVVAPTGLGLSCQTSAAAVAAAHVDVTAFTAALAARVGEHATGVTRADASYVAQEAVSTEALAAIFQQTVHM
jgi:predicted trehalose synthase